MEGPRSSAPSPGPDDGPDDAPARPDDALEVAALLGPPDASTAAMEVLTRDDLQDHRRHLVDGGWTEATLAGAVDVFIDGALNVGRRGTGGERGLVEAACARAAIEAPSAGSLPSNALKGFLNAALGMDVTPLRVRPSNALKGFLNAALGRDVKPPTKRKASPAAELSNDAKELWWHCKEGYLAAAQALAATVDVLTLRKNGKNEGQTCLHAATMPQNRVDGPNVDNVEVLRWLLELGLSLDDVDAKGKTPVELALDHGDADVVGFLREHCRAHRITLPEATQRKLDDAADAPPDAYYTLPEAFEGAAKLIDAITGEQHTCEGLCDKMKIGKMKIGRIVKKYFKEHQPRRLFKYGQGPGEAFKKILYTMQDEGLIRGGIMQWYFGGGGNQNVDSSRRLKATRSSG